MGENKKAEDAVTKMINYQVKNGSFPQSKTSITRSSGKSLLIETTSLALLSMLKVNPDKWADQIKKSVDFLLSSMNCGYFGSTQATILAMKALVEFMKENTKISDECLFEVSLNSSKYSLKVGDNMKYPEKGLKLNFF